MQLEMLTVLAHTRASLDRPAQQHTYVHPSGDIESPAMLRRPTHVSWSCWRDLY